MARTPSRLTALGVAMALVFISGTNPSLSEALSQDEPGHRARRQEALRQGDVRRQWAYVPTPATARRPAPSPWPMCSGSSKRRDPGRLLIHDALDEDGVGTTRVQAHATIRVTIPLPPWISMADDPGATHVTVFRGIPSTRNTPALDPVLMHDGRAPTLQEQALGAIHDHYQNTSEPTVEQLDAIAEFQRTDARFFSTHGLRKFAATGAPPELPPGRTPAERRGREFLVDAPFAPPSKKGICALCHGGPMLNMVNQAHSNFVGGSPPPGVRFINTGVTLVNAPNNPIRRWIVDDGVNPPVTIDSPDLGLLLDPTPPAAQPPPSVIPRAFFAEMFKIPTLWGVADTAPYFHNNGAKTLRDAVAHYQRFFNFTEEQDPVGSRSLGGFITLTDDDVDDIVAYLQLLGPNRKDK